ncbi:MAG: hypothetical protein IKX88_10185 [Thermoguttaceae bacterium]|nr:hypothetical protein [Thermoguttaceae bacterium]MBR5758951.1 hypothetical protein [Thermoguttaceae bacterium]
MPTSDSTLIAIVFHADDSSAVEGKNNRTVDGGLYVVCVYNFTSYADDVFPVGLDSVDVGFFTPPADSIGKKTAIYAIKKKIIRNRRPGGAQALDKFWRAQRSFRYSDHRDAR